MAVSGSGPGWPAAAPADADPPKTTTMSTVGALAKTVGLIMFFSVIITVFAMVVGASIGCSAWVMLPVVLALSLTFSLGSAFFSDRMVSWMYGVKEIKREHRPRLWDCVADVAAKAKLPMPRVGIMHSATPNAFATGWGPSRALVVATTGLLDLLDDRELRGVIAHELAHVGNRDILTMSVASALASTMTWMSMLLLFSRERGSFFLYLAGYAIAALASAIIVSAVSRTREFAADATGAATVSDPLGLASALAKLERGVRHYPYGGNRAGESLFIVNPFRGERAVSLFSTHPPTRDRIERLERQASRMR